MAVHKKNICGQKLHQWANCKECPFREQLIVPPTINKNPKFIVLGEYPYWADELTKMPYSDESEAGHLLMETFAEAGIYRDHLHITNAVLCRPFRHSTGADYAKAMLCCRGRLHKELQHINSDYIIGFGSMALKTIANKGTARSGIADWMGYPLTGTYLKDTSKKTLLEYEDNNLYDFRDYQIFPIYSPSFCYLNPAYTPIMKAHVRRAIAVHLGLLDVEEDWGEMYIHADEEGLAALDRILRAKKLTAFDIETMGEEPLTDKIMCLSLANEDVGVCVPWNGYYGKGGIWVKGLDEYSTLGGQIRQRVKEILESEDVPITCHNGPHDILGIKYDPANIIVQNYAYDSLSAHATTAPQVRHGLGFVHTCEFFAPRWKSVFGVIRDLKGADKFIKRREEVLRTYCCKDSIGTIQISNKTIERTAKDKVLDTEVNFRHKLMKITMKMKEHGILVDDVARQAHRKPILDRELAALAAVRQVAGAEFNPNSSKQIRKLFFETFEVPVTIRTPKGDPSTDKNVLKELLSYPDERVKYCAAQLSAYRRYNKLRTTYIDNLPLFEDGTVHVDWLPYGKVTGRWSATFPFQNKDGKKLRGPGIQTIPKPKTKTVIREDGTKEEKVIAPGLRNMFVARPDMLIVRADYSQLEARIIALLAGAQKLIEAFKDPKTDIHRYVASILFDIDMKDVTPKQRQAAKPTGYGINYGVKEENLWATLSIDFPEITLTQVYTMFERYLSENPEITAFQQEAERMAREDRKIVCPISGREYKFHDGKIDINKVYNHRVQGTGADIIDRAILDVEANIDWVDSALLLQVHDELVLEGADPYYCFDLLKKYMEREVQLNGHTCVFPVDVTIGYDWANTHDVKNHADVKKILERLNFERKRIVAVPRGGKNNR